MLFSLPETVANNICKEFTSYFIYYFVTSPNNTKNLDLNFIQTTLKCHKNVRMVRDHSFSTYSKLFKKSHDSVRVFWGKKCKFFWTFSLRTKWMILPIYHDFFVTLSSGMKITIRLMQFWCQNASCIARPNEIHIFLQVLYYFF